MKLKNFMFATMIACAFASCSEDDAVENGPDQGNASFTVSMEVQNAKETKAFGSDITGENSINTLAVFVYNEAKTQIIAQQWLDNNETSCTFTGLTANQNVWVYAYANLADAPAPTSYGEGVAVAMGNGFSSNNLPMAGATASAVPLTVAGPNVATVELNRSVSRVDVVNLTLDVTKGTQYQTGKLFDPADFRQAIFNTKGFSVNGVSASALTTGKDVNCATFIGGLAQNLWGNSDVEAAGNKSFLKDYNFASIEDNELKGRLTYSTQAPDEDGTSTLSATTIYDGGENNAALVSYYVLPNAENKLTMVLEGEFGYTVDNTSVAPAQSFYPFVIAKDGEVDGNTNGGDGVITQNKVYRVSITVAGYGASGGNKADLVVDTEVLNYTLSTQKVVIE